MTSIHGRRDADLHWPDGSHRTTPASTKGRVLEGHEKRLQKHLAEHEAEAKAAEKEEQ